MKTEKTTILSKLIIIAVATVVLFAGLICKNQTISATTNEQQKNLVSAVVVEQSELTVTDNSEATQKIAVAFNDDIDNYYNLELTIIGPEDKTTVLQESKRADQTALFEYSYSMQDIGSYQVGSIEYTVKEDNRSHVLYFANVQINAEFKVVSAENTNITTISSDDMDEVSGQVENLLVSANAQTTLASSGNDNIVVTLDPGHGGDDAGACYYNMQEKALNLAIALACKAELEEYGVTVFMTRSTDVNTAGSTAKEVLLSRVAVAANSNSNILVSIHNNALGTGAASGSEIYYPYNASYNNHTYVTGLGVSEKIMSELSALGMNDRGVRTKLASGDDYKYATGEDGDYYGIIRYARQQGIPAIIVEHAYMDNESDAAKLQDSNFLKQLGIADATGIANYYGLSKYVVTEEGDYYKFEKGGSVVKETWITYNNKLIYVDSNGYVKKSVVDENAVEYSAHVSDIGWQDTVSDGAQAGTTGASKQVEAIKIDKGDAVEDINGAIQYKSYVEDDGWETSWSTDNAISGTTGEDKHIEAVKIRLTEDLEDQYDIYYRVHVSNIGWLGWAKNGQSAGTVGYSYQIEALQVVLVEKSTPAPGSTDNAFVVKDSGTGMISYTTHVQNVGWQDYVSDGEMAGTSGQSLRLEGIYIKKGQEAIDAGYTGSIQYKTHIQNIGWESEWKADGELSGTSGQSLRLEAIKIKLTDDLAEDYDVYYRVHAQNIGWMGWAKNGQSAGTAGYSYRLEGIEIQLVEKGGDAPGSTSGHYIDASSGTGMISYTTHVQNVGWQDYVSDGETAGTSGQSLRLEGIYIKKGQEAIDAGYTGSIQYKTHIQNIGWESEWKADGELSGTSGQSLRLEAIQIQLTDDLAEDYDVYYRVHAQNVGWMGWAMNGQSAGTAGYSYRLEGIQIQLVEKGGEAPGSTEDCYIEATDKTLIAGTTLTSKTQMITYFNKYATYPSFYSTSDAPTLDDFCQIYIEEAAAEGIRAEVAFCQSMKETGWLKFGGQVQISQYNFAGLGATDGGASGASFSTVREGVRAQIQHLKAYATTTALNNTCVDPRFSYVTRGVAPYVEWLGIQENPSGKGWASAKNYGYDIVSMMKQLLSC